MAGQGRDRVYGHTGRKLAVCFGGRFEGRAYLSRYIPDCDYYASEGNTPVPSGESLKSLAAHGATMAIFLSISRIDEVANELLAGGYKPDTPAAVVYRASWEDQQVLRTTIKDLAKTVQSAGIKKQALILVREFPSGT